MAKKMSNAAPVGKAKDGRTRNWNVIVYPESAPENWRQIIDDLHIEWAESPLHDQDLDATGETKKAHWHILLAFEGMKSFDQVKEITDQLNAPIPQRCAGLRGSIRYMAHMDNPDKHQYPVSHIIGHGGFDVAAQLRATGSERYQLIGEMIEFCSDHNIGEVSDLLMYALKHRPDDWFPILCDSGMIVMQAHVRSIRHKADPARSDFRKGIDPKSAHESAGLQKLSNGSMVDIDPETGEIFGMILPPIGR